MNKIDSDYIESRYHLRWGDGWLRSVRYGLPVLNREFIVPDRVVPFDKIDRTSDKRGCVIFNLADRRIDRIWNNPERYIERLRQFDCVTTPDFSLLLNMERPFIEYNVLRSLKLGRWMQDQGVHVLPTVMWAYPDTYDVCFEGMPKKSVLFVSSVGSFRRKESRTYFLQGMKVMLDRLDPVGIVLYGPMPSFDFAVPVVRHFDRVSPTCFNSYQPDLI